MVYFRNFKFVSNNIKPQILRQISWGSTSESLGSLVGMFVAQEHCPFPI